jgi:8-oxo-dGTP pyrophosphatase MutT (NUDIX family)
MEINSQTVTGPARPAATVVMLRDNTTGDISSSQGSSILEVFLIKRHGLSDVLGGAYVFPGGKVDRFDAELDMDTHLDLPPADLHAALHEPDIEPLTAAGLYVAALREAFEESGVLFAQNASAQFATADDAARAYALLREGHAFEEVLALMKLRLTASSLTPWSRWITPTMPSVMSKRFDTRFFISEAPANQVARHDNHEATESIWLSPRAALEQYRDGQIELAPPQIMSLAHLSRYADVRSALHAARSQRPPVIQPEPFDDDGVRVLTYPGDARHSVKVRALPGPTRLRYANKRFEPFLGFDALFVDS